MRVQNGPQAFFGRFCGVCLVVGASKLQDQAQQPEQEQAKSISFYRGFRRDVRHSLDVFLGLPRPSLPLSFAVRRPFLWGVSGGRCVDCFCGVCLVAGASKLQDQKGAKTWPKASVSIEGSEGTLGILWTLFWAFPVLHCP